MTLPGLAGLGILVLSIIMLGIFAFLQRRSTFSFRRIRSLVRIARSARLVVEDGTRLHFSLGSGNMLTQEGASALAGLALLRRLGEISSLSDLPPVATTGSGLLNLLTQDTLRSAHDSVGLGQSFEWTNSRMTGLSPFAYVAGALPAMSHENITSNILIGNFGPEVGLLAEAAGQNNALVIGASDNLAGQAVLLASSAETLIGEELFAAAAYNQGGAFHSASLVLQDVLRWLIILALIGGAGLKMAGVL